MKRWPLTLALTLGVSMSSALAAGTITVWYAGNFQGHIDVVNKTVLPGFKAANPDVNVRVEFIPWGDLSTKLNAAFAAGTAPDVFMHGAAATAGFASNSRIESLEPYLKEIDAADFGPTLNQGKYAGARYMMPVFGAGRLLVYRKDLFQAAGLDPNKAPKTWTGLLNAARKLTTRDASGRIVRAGLLLTSNGIDLQQVFASFYFQTGGEFFSDDLKSVAFNNPKGVKAVRFMQQLFDPKTGVSPLGEPPSPVSPLMTGRAAMIYAVPDDISDLKTSNPDLYAKLGVAPPTKDQIQSTMYSFSGFFLSKDSKDKADAWKYIKYATSGKVLEAFNAAAASVPPLNSLVKADFVTSNPVLTAYMQNLRFAHGNPNIPIWVKARDILSAKLEEAMYGRISAAEALSQAAKDITAELKR